MLPDTIKIIEKFAFANCMALLDVNLNDNITLIGDNAFYNTGQVKINKLPNALVEIGQNAFQNAGPNITITELPPNLTKIGSFGFHGCPNIAISHFGSEDGTGLQTIGVGAFSNCGKGISTIYLHSSISLIDYNQYYGGFGQIWAGGADGYSEETLTWVYYYKDLNLYNSTFENDGSNFLAQLGLGHLANVGYGRQEGV